MPKVLKLDRAGKLKLSEADVVLQVEDWLKAHRWEILRTGYGEIYRDGRPVAWVGEVGMPDAQARRWKGGNYCEVIWLEYKRPKCAGYRGGILGPAQRLWLAAETARGGLCVVVDNLDQFKAWYRQHIGPEK